MRKVPQFILHSQWRECALAFLVILTAAGCNTPLADAYALKYKICKTVAKKTGYKTIWNEDIACKLGNVYELRESGNTSHWTIIPVADDAVADAAKLTGTDSDVVTSPLHYTVSYKPYVNAQLGYMGVSGCAIVTMSKTVSFTAESGTAKAISEEQKLDDALTSDLSHSFKQRILEDEIQRLTKPYQKAQFWVVYGKSLSNNLSVLITVSGTNNIGAGITDSSQLKAFLSTSNVPTFNFSAGDSGYSQESTLALPGVFPVGAMFFPLGADKEADGIHVWIDKGFLEAINSEH